jgi:hypothetical protein
VIQKCFIYLKRDGMRIGTLYFKSNGSLIISHVKGYMLFLEASL